MSLGKELRLELLKLCHRGDRSPDDVVALAKVYEEYLLGEYSKEPAKAEASCADKVIRRRKATMKDDNLI